MTGETIKMAGLETSTYAKEFKGGDTVGKSKIGVCYTNMNMIKACVDLSGTPLRGQNSVEVMAAESRPFDHACTCRKLVLAIVRSPGTFIPYFSGFIYQGSLPLVIRGCIIVGRNFTCTWIQSCRK